MISDYLPGKILVILFMLFCAAEDFIENKISIYAFAVMFAFETVGYVLLFIKGISVNYISALTGAGAGLLIFALRRVSKGGIGMGDAIFFTLTGIALGGPANILLFLTGMLCGALYGLFISVYGSFKGRRIKRGESFAFLPLVLPAGIVLTIIK